MAYKVTLNGIEVKRQEDVVMASDQSVEIKEINEKERTLTAIASTEAEDRDKDIIMTNGWELDNYTKNPVGLWCHDYRCMPVFRTDKIVKDTQAKALMFTAKFAEHDHAKDAFQAYAGGYMSAFSVGFIPKKVAPRDPQDPWWSGQEYTQQELLEISSVPVPANPEALVQLRSLKLAQNAEPTAAEVMGLPESLGMTKDGHVFMPVADVHQFTNPMELSMKGGIYVISGRKMNDPKTGEEASVVALPIGYRFDPEVISAKEMQAWLSENAPQEKEIIYFDLKTADEGDETPFELVEGESTKQAIDLPDEEALVKLLGEEEEAKDADEEQSAAEDQGEAGDDKAKSDEADEDGQKATESDEPEEGEDSSKASDDNVEISKLIISVSVMGKDGALINTIGKTHSFEGPVDMAEDLDELIKSLFNVETSNQHDMSVVERALAEIKELLTVKEPKDNTEEEKDGEFALELVDEKDDEGNPDKGVGDDESELELDSDLFASPSSDDDGSKSSTDDLGITKSEAKEVIHSALTSKIKNIFEQALADMGK